MTDQPGRLSVFTDRPKKHKPCRGHWDLDSCQVSLNWLQQFQWRSWKCFSQSETRAAILFSDCPEKHELRRGRWDLASYPVSVQRFKRSPKCLSQSEARGGHLVFPIAKKNTNWVKDVKILLPVKCRWIPFSGFRGEVENVSANQTPGWPSCFSDRLKKHKHGRGCWDLASCQVSMNSVQQFHRRSRKYHSQSEARAAILFFLIAPENTNLVEDFEILLPIKIRWIRLSGFRGVVKYVSANQRPGQPYYFSDRPQKHKFGRKCWDLAFIQVSLNFLLWFQRKRRKCLTN